MCVELDYGGLYGDDVTAADSPIQSSTRPYDIQIERKKERNKGNLVMGDTVNNLPKTEVHENI